MILIVYAWSMLLLWVGVSVYLLVQSRKVILLRHVSPLPDDAQPSVVVIIAVKDEELEVEAALRSVCNLTYRNYRILVINDRSTDNTPAILEKMVKLDSRLSLITINELEKGWLGKNYALYKGYQASSEEWLLFTDADVTFAPEALNKAMNLVLENKLDHLTVLPQVTSQSSLFMSVMNTFALMLEVKLRPWDVSDPSSKASMGVGAFNLVRKSAYEKAGTHSVISLRPDDDLKLGERIKKAHFRQEVAYGNGEIWLQWYTSLSHFINGLMKNTFSVANYNLFIALGMALSTFLLVVLPMPLLLLSGLPHILMAMVILLAQVSVMVSKKGLTARWWHALVIPFAGLVMVYIIIRSAILTLQQGGIYWRDSFYPLTELKKQT